MQFTIQNPNLQFRNQLSRRTRTNAIILHHLAADVDVETVHRWHLGNGWAGIGYHFQVDLDGRIWQGRPIDTVGAHTLGHNSETIGIACRGDFHNVIRQMPARQREALLWLIRHIRGSYGMIPINGHRERAATACPGQFFPLDEIRRQAEQEETGMTEEAVRNIVNQMLQETLAGAGTKPSPWAKPEWERAIEAEITDGTRPRGYVTREEAAIMAYRARSVR